MLMNQTVLRRPNIYGPTPFSAHLGTLLFRPRFPYREPDISSIPFSSHSPSNSSRDGGSPSKKDGNKKTPPPVPAKPVKSPPPPASTKSVKSVGNVPTTPSKPSTVVATSPPPSVSGKSPPGKSVTVVNSGQYEVSPPSVSTAKSPIIAPTVPVASVGKTDTKPPFSTTPARNAFSATPYSSSKKEPTPVGALAKVVNAAATTTVSPPPVSKPAASPTFTETCKTATTPAISAPVEKFQPMASPTPAPPAPHHGGFLKSFQMAQQPPIVEKKTTDASILRSPPPQPSIQEPSPVGHSTNYGAPKPSPIGHSTNHGVQEPFLVGHSTNYGVQKPSPTTHSTEYGVKQPSPIGHSTNYGVQQPSPVGHSTNYGVKQPSPIGRSTNTNYGNGHHHHNDGGLTSNGGDHDCDGYIDQNDNLYTYQKDHDFAHRHETPKAQMPTKATNLPPSHHQTPPLPSSTQIVSGPNKLKFIPTRIMVQEIDEGQPCLACKGTCPGFRPHCWRKICVHCKCVRDSHDIYQRNSADVFDRIGLKADSRGTMHLAKGGTVGSSYTWVPAGLVSNKIDEYMSQLPNHKVPRVHTPGEKYRNKQLVVQLPRQDLASAYCKHLMTVAEQKAFEDFVNTRNEMALDIGYVNPVLDKSMECRKCKGVLERNELAVMAPKFGTNVCWHPACFVCCSCDELLVDLTYCVRDGKIFCERHYAESNKPRCAACDELIFAGEYTKAMNQDWHSGHFCCWQCDQSLTGQRYILRDDHPYCIKCYEEVFANSCDECAKPIGIDSKDLSYKEKHWHEHCFLCSMCKVSLVDKPFGSKNDRIFCASCYDQAFATRCDGCGEIFKAGMKKMEYKGKQWHDKCFCCALCKGPIGTKSFIPKNDEVYCATCYEEKFATRCTKCKKVISSGGVTYKNEPWHKECFCCCNCGASLAGQRFTSKDEKPYCANCFGELFAKRCTACTQPITGIGGSKFISFEDRHWHNDCFVCAQCQTSLVGKGFITDSADVLCPECAKARLMAQHA